MIDRRRSVSFRPYVPSPNRKQSLPGNGKCKHRNFPRKKHAGKLMDHATSDKRKKFMGFLINARNWCACRGLIHSDHRLIRQSGKSRCRRLVIPIREISSGMKSKSTISIFQSMPNSNFTINPVEVLWQPDCQSIRNPNTSEFVIYLKIYVRCKALVCYIQIELAS